MVLGWTSAVARRPRSSAPRYGLAPSDTQAVDHPALHTTRMLPCVTRTDTSTPTEGKRKRNEATVSTTPPKAVALSRIIPREHQQRYDTIQHRFCTTPALAFPDAPRRMRRRVVENKVKGAPGGGQARRSPPLGPVAAVAAARPPGEVGGTTAWGGPPPPSLPSHPIGRRRSTQRSPAQPAGEVRPTPGTSTKCGQPRLSGGHAGAPPPPAQSSTLPPPAPRAIHPYATQPRRSRRAVSPRAPPHPRERALPAAAGGPTARARQRARPCADCIISPPSPPPAVGRNRRAKSSSRAAPAHA